MLWGASQWTRLLISQAHHTQGDTSRVPLPGFWNGSQGFMSFFLWHVVGKRLNLMRNKQVGDEQRHIIISTHNVIRHRVEAAYGRIGSSLGWGGNGVVTESVYFNITLRWRMQVSRRNCNILAISGGKAQLDFTALLGIHPSIPSPSTHQPSVVLCKQAEEEEAP